MIRIDARCHKLWGALAAALACVAAAMPAHGQVFCSEPIAPSCLEVQSTTRDSLSVRRCQQDVEEFAQEVTEYLACLDQNARSLEQRVTTMRDRIEQMETKAKEEEKLPPAP
jgi:hypothetical protein